MNDTELTALFTAEGPPAEPPLPPEYLERALAAGRRSVRRRRMRLAASGIAVLLILAVLTPLVARPDQAPPPASPTGPPTLPERFPGLSRFTADAVDRPPGRAIAFYEYGSSELFTTWQWLVAGADRDVYRQVPPTTEPAEPALLSPDGRSLLYFRRGTGTDEFHLFNLETGRERTLRAVPWNSNTGEGVDLLAWSPDGRYVAYAVPAPPPADGTAAGSYFNGRAIKQLAILDVVTGDSVRYPDLSHVYGATFAPDGRRLAVQMAFGSWVVSVDGSRLHGVELPNGAELVDNVGWSPDGRLLATLVRSMARPGAVSEPGRIRFVDATGAGGPIPADLPYEGILGWSSGTTVLATTWLDGEGVTAIVAAPVDGAPVAVVSRFTRDTTCEYGLQTCEVYRLQLATGLLAGIGQRPADPDRGPLVPLMGALPWLLAVFGAVLVSGWAYRRQRRRAG